MTELYRVLSYDGFTADTLLCIVTSIKNIVGLGIAYSDLLTLIGCMQFLVTLSNHPPTLTVV